MPCYLKNVAEYLNIAQESSTIMNKGKLLLTSILLAASTSIYSQTKSNADFLNQITPETTFQYLTPNLKPTTIPFIAPALLIDPGHNEKHIGKHYKNLKEEEIVLDIAKEIKKSIGDTLQVYLTRTDKEFLDSNYHKDLQKRIDIRQKINPEYNIHLHINSFNKPHVKGMEIYYFGVSQNL